MSINVNDKNLGHATAYAYYKAGGGTMTEAEFTEFMADFGTASQTAVEAAQAALASKNAAQTAATTATNKASEATTAATTATTKAGEASTSASTATSAKDTAVSAASTATTKATEATTAAATATSAKTDAVAANTAAQSAKTAAQTAQTGAETAAASVEASAEQIATNAEDISQLKSEITDKADTADMLKAFPTDTASGSVASFADGANVPVKSLIVNIEPVQEGSGDPSPDNVRPISGWSEVNVQRTGKNLAYLEQGTLDFAHDGSEVDSTTRVRTGFIPVKPNIDYIASSDGWVIKNGVAYDADKNYIGYGGQFYPNGTTGALKITDSNVKYVRFIYGNSGNTDCTPSDMWYQFEKGTTATPYEPYSGTSLNIALGQTVYGGTLDVVSGVLTIEDAKNIYDGSDDEDWQVNSIGSGICAMMITDNTTVNVSANTDTNINARSDRLQGQSANDIVYNRTAYKVGIITNHRFLATVKDTDATGVTGFKSWLASNPITVCYKLDTPLTIQLDPHEVTALLGSNNIWADSGDSEVVYRADPTLYIQRLTEPDADMVADSNITSGQYFMVGNTLYKATANIASGATISPNVNCTRKSLSEALNELNS